jgi:HEAT repeat protein/glycerophosphoryl diester phosphodiesterase
MVKEKGLRKILLTVLFCLLYGQPSVYSQGRSEVIIAANSGVRYAAPENTMVALELAVEQGARALKVDVRSTSDGKLVLMSDETIDRTTNGHGILKKIFFDELRLYDAGSWLSTKFQGETVPLLREALRFAKLNHLKLILDVKEHGLEKAILSLLEDTGMQKEVYLWGTLSNLREIEPSIVGPKLVFLSPANLTPSEVHDVHARGAQVMTSLLNCDDRERIKEVAELGPDILLVDYPAVAVEALGRLRAQTINVIKIRKRLALSDLSRVGQASLPGELPAESPVDYKEETEGFDLLDPVHSLYNLLIGDRLEKQEVQEGLPSDLRERLVALSRTLKEPGLADEGFFAKRWRRLNRGLEEGEVEESRKSALMLAALPPEAVLPVLLKALEYKRPAVRANAAWSLGLVGDSRALPALVKHLWDEDIEVRREAITALGRLKQPEAVEPLRQVLTSKMDASVIYEAARALGEIRSPEAVADLIKVMEKDPDWRVKGACAMALSKIGEKRAAEPLGRLLLQESGDPLDGWLKDIASYALSDMGEGAPVLKALRSVRETTRKRASWTMVRMGEGAIPFLTKALRDPNPMVSQKAAETLGWLGSDKAVDSLIRVIKAEPPPSDGLKRTAIWALGKIGDPRAEKALDEIARKEKDNEIKEMAEEAMLRLSQR